MVTVSYTFAGGIVAGLIVNLMRGNLAEAPSHYFHDGVYWEGVCDLEGAPTSLALPETVLPAGGAATVYVEPNDGVSKETAIQIHPNNGSVNGDAGDTNKPLPPINKQATPPLCPLPAIKGPDGPDAAELP